MLASCHNQQNATQNKKYDDIINRVKQKFVPDSRDHIFEIKFDQKDNSLILSGTSDYPQALNALTDSLEKHHISFKDQVRMLPLKEFKNKIGITRLSVANLRSKPEHSAELVTQTLMGTPLHIFENKNGFYHVQTPEGYYAWGDAAGIKILNQHEFQDWLSKEKMIVTAVFGQVYEKPNKNANPVSDMVINDVFAKLEVEDNFVKVLYPDGRTGYISTENLVDLNEFDATNKQYALPDDVIIFAGQFLGIPYLWGGTSAKGMDCSGFTKTVYASLGYLLPRDASQQVKVGKKIDLDDNFSQLRAGDLLFFGKIKNGKEKITHVAIHIKNGKIIHATGEVKIESLNPKDKNYNPDRKKSLLQARRILGNMPLDFSKSYKK